MLFLAGLAVVGDSYLTPPVVMSVVAALYAVPLGLVRRSPLRAWRVVVVTALVSPILVQPVPAEILPWPPTQIVVALIVCFGVALRHHWQTVIAAATVTALVLGWGLSFVATAARDEQWAGGAALVAVTMLVGYLIGARGEMARRLDEGERLRLQSEARQAVLAERARIAGELHDVVAHHMSMITVRAETAPYEVDDLECGGTGWPGRSGV